MYDDHHDDELEDHDRGLAFDLSTLVQRRRALQLIGVGGLATLVACGSSGTKALSSVSSSSSSSSSTAPSTSSASSSGSSLSDCTTIPEETAGPFPGDGSNGPQVLTQSGIVRSDIRPSFGSSTTVATGIPLTINLTIADASACTALGKSAVYIWHCDQQGRYSMYSQGVTNENYLRGVQEADANGKLTFTSIWPACYSGRWPHIHFEVYKSLTDATSAGSKLATSQIAMPADANTLVFASGYEQSVKNVAQTSLTKDMVFGDDGAAHQLPTVSGDVNAGFTIDFTAAV